jgi:hypothetical protein
MPSQRFYRTQSASLTSAVRATATELSLLVGYQPLAAGART